MFSIDDFWQILDKIRGEDTEVDANIASILQNEKTLVENFFSHAVDQIAFNTESYQKLRKFIIEWYAAHRSIVTTGKNVNDIYFLPETHLNELIRSFGFDFNLNLLDKNTKCSLLLDLCNLYKSKGTPISLYKILNYYGYSGIDIVEYWLQFNKKGNLIYQPRVIYPLPSNSIVGLEPLSFKELENTDPHWRLSNREILKLHQENKISLPSLTPYFGIYYNIYLDKVGLAIAIINRYCQDDFNEWVRSSIEPNRNIRLSSSFSYVSLLELYLACVYTFTNVYSEENFGVPYVIEHIEQSIYADTPSDFLVYTERSGDDLDFDILVYAGDNTTATDIIHEVSPIYTRSFTRTQRKNKNDFFDEILTVKASTKFFQSLDEVASILEDLNPNFKQNIDAALLTEGKFEYLIVLLKDLSNWIKINIGPEYANIDELVNSLLQDKEMSKIINFFKPYRTRLLELKQLFPFIMNEVIPEDSCEEPKIIETIVDFDTADGHPCCQDEYLDCMDSTTSYYTREQFDCGNLYDRGACDTSKSAGWVDDDYGIEIPYIQDDFYITNMCLMGDTTAISDTGYSIFVGKEDNDIQYAWQSNGFSDFDSGATFDCPIGYDLMRLLIHDIPDQYSGIMDIHITPNSECRGIFPKEKYYGNIPINMGMICDATHFEGFVISEGIPIHMNMSYDGTIFQPIRIVCEGIEISMAPSYTAEKHEGYPYDGNIGIDMSMYCDATKFEGFVFPWYFEGMIIRMGMTCDSTMMEPTRFVSDGIEFTVTPSSFHKKNEAYEFKWYYESMIIEIELTSEVEFHLGYPYEGDIPIEIGLIGDSTSME